MSNEWKISPLGDSAVLISFGTSMDRSVQDHVQQFARLLHQHPFPGCIEYVPAYNSVTVLYDPIICSYEHVVLAIESIWAASDLSSQPLLSPMVIPVYYGGASGPDLKYLADYHDLTESEVIQLHTSAQYVVSMIGFTPGFPYLTGLPTELATPRRAEPRTSVPAGSVGIAGVQTGIYPQESPGGWQIIGNTPIPLFDVSRIPPALLQPLQPVQFQSISYDDYLALKEDYR